MSVTGITGSAYPATYNPAPVQSKFQQFQQEFQQLGQDLQSGNLSQAQSDFATLQQNAPAGSPFSSASTSSTSTSGTSSTSPANTASPANTISQAINQLAQDLQSGNLTSAQSDFATLQQDLQQSPTQGAQGHGHHHHHHHVENSDSSNGPGSAINQAFGQLGQALQSGNLQSAQQAYSTLQQDFQEFAALGGTSTAAPSSSAPAASGSLNVAA
jgi:hypothetical protein